MASIGIVHHYFEVPGGAESVCVHAARALLDAGHDVTIYTLHPWGVENACRAFNVDCGGFRVEKLPRAFTASLLEFVTRKRAFRMWIEATQVNGFLSAIEKMRQRHDLVIHTHGILPFNVDIQYTHFPEFHYSKFFRFKEHRGLARKVYDRVTNYFVKHLLDKVNGFDPLILTNSQWTADAIWKVWRRKAVVLHPPVDVEFYSQVYDNTERGKVVVTVSRLVPGKHIEKVVDVAAMLRDYRFIIAGRTTPLSDVVLSRIERRKKELGADNVDVVLNPSNSELRALYGGARFYLHPPFPEHFGISIAEAVAAGTIPVVFKNGGCYTDIAAKIDPGLGYFSVEEVPRIIRGIEGDEEKAESLRRRGKELVQNFTREKFMKGFASLVSGVLDARARGGPRGGALRV